MNSRISILLVSGAAAVVLIALVIVVFASGSSADQLPGINDAGSFLHPQVMRGDRAGYVLAELYQDVRLDVESGVYDADGALLGRYWNHDARTQTCSVDLTLADQHGRDEIAPTATLRPTHTPLPTDPPWHPEEYAVVERTIDTDNGAGIALALLPTPRADWPTSTPRPTYTPYPTATPTVVSATGWHHWKGRPIAVETDGTATLDVPRDADVSAYLSVRTGPDSGHESQVELARLPLPEPRWSNGAVYIRLSDASGRVLLNSDDIDAHYRAAVLHVAVAPLGDCGGLRLRWQRPAAVVVKALTDQPFTDWGDGSAPPPTRELNAPVYAAVGPDDSFDADDMMAGSSSTVAGHVVIPGAAVDSRIAFAVRADLYPNGLTDVRQNASPFNARDAFSPGINESDDVLNIGGTDYKLYVSLQPWRHQLLGGEWSLR